MSDMNPYESPQTTVTRYEHYPTATMGWRLINLLVDWAGIFALSFVVGVLMYMFNLGHILENSHDLVVGAALCLIYYWPQEALTGRTLGKLVSGTRVVDLNGEPIGWGRALKRSLVRLVPFEAFSFLTENRPRGWHDAWTGTRVISLRESEQAEQPEAPAQTE